ncbi:MAG: hypothetical protein ACREX8_14045, partial [Gammaproteobacteria bacterium]
MRAAPVLAIAASGVTLFGAAFGLARVTDEDEPSVTRPRHAPAPAPATLEGRRLALESAPGLPRLKEPPPPPKPKQPPPSPPAAPAARSAPAPAAETVSAPPPEA